MSQSRCIGILREVKNKWERRSPLSPTDVGNIVKKGIQVIIQPSTMRIFPDHAYAKAGALVSDDLTPCKTILGVKEFPINNLIPNKSYLIFSHTIKAQSYNMPFLDACLNNKIRLFDYETIRSTGPNGGRLVAFGKFAGLAGAIDGLRGVGERALALGFSTPFMAVSSSYMYPSLEAAKRAVRELGEEIKLNGLPLALCPLTIVVTGQGNVSTGAQEIFNLLPIEWVSPDRLSSLPADRFKIYGCVVTSKDMVIKNDQTEFNSAEYYKNPSLFSPVFHKNIAPFTSVLVNSMYWDPRFPRLITNEQMRQINAESKARGLPRAKLLADIDITCDIKGSVEFLKRSTTIDKPFFIYDPEKDETRDLIEGNGVLVMGVDNLPAEFPKEATNHFSKALSPFIESLARSDHERPFLTSASEYMQPEIFNSCIVADGALTPNFAYISQLRLSQERAQEEKAVDLEIPSMYVLIEGHLFDSGFINQALDLFEHAVDNFKIVHWDISPNRVDRHTNISRAIIKLSSKAKEQLKAALDKVILLSSLSPNANAKISEVKASDLPSDSEKSPSPSIRSAPTKRVLILGSGYVAAPVVAYLTSKECNYAVTVASLSLSEAESLVRGIDHTRAVQLDVADKASVNKLVSDHDLTISLLPATMHIVVAEACISARKHLVTASYVSKEMASLNEKAVKAGVALVNEMGLDPGIDHMSAMAIIDDVRSKGGRIRSFLSLCGGLPAPEAADNPFAYKFSWSPMGMLNAVMNPAVWLENNSKVTLPAGQVLSNAKPYHLNKAYSLEFYPNRDSLSYIDTYGLSNVSTMMRGTLRYSGFSSLLDGFVKLGLFSKLPVPLDSNSNSWFSVMSKLLNSSKTYGSQLENKQLLDSLIVNKLAENGVSDKMIPQILNAVDFLGLNSSSPVFDKGQSSGSFVPIEAFCRTLQSNLYYQPHERDLVLMQHEIKVEWPGSGPSGSNETKTINSTLISYGGDGEEKVNKFMKPAGGSGLKGYSAMARTVGLPAAIASDLLLTGQISSRGVLIPSTKEFYKPILEKLSQEAIHCREVVLSK